MEFPWLPAKWKRTAERAFWEVSVPCLTSLTLPALFEMSTGEWASSVDICCTGGLRGYFSDYLISWCWVCCLGSLIMCQSLLLFFGLKLFTKTWINKSSMESASGATFHCLRLLVLTVHAVMMKVFIKFFLFIIWIILSDTGHCVAYWWVTLKFLWGMCSLL